LLGHIPQLRSEGMLSLFERSWAAFGDVFGLHIGVEGVAVAHPDAIKQVLATNAKNYVKGSSYDGVRRVIGNGVLALEGDAWKARRTLIQPAFHRSALGKLTEAMTDTGRLHFDALRAAHPGEGDFVIDAHRDMVKLTLDVVTAALFGRELLGVAQVSHAAFGTALELVSAEGNGFLLPKWLPTPGNRRFNATMAEVEAVIYRVIAEGRKRDGTDGTLLSLLIHSTDAETGRRLTDQEVRDEVFTMFIAGHETTALTLTWLFTLLHGRPEIIEAMVAEVDRVLGDRDPVFEDFPKLTYLRQVIDETLRLRGPVAMTARTAVAEDELAGVRVKPGMLVFPFFYGAQRHKDFWASPNRFDPAHFAPERSKGRNPWSYVPFSAGQRQCIGMMFSLVETVVLLAQLLRRFTLTIEPGVDQVKPITLVTVRPDRPVLIRLKPRGAGTKH
jgi:cytochrome P450